MTIRAEVIKDSINTENTRLTTLRIVLPKSLLAQFNTHRVFSRNFSSSRAIPVKTVIQQVEVNPVMPIWTRNKPGMVGELITDEFELLQLNNTWLEARDSAVAAAKSLMGLEGHKQTVNRILEPYMYAQGIVTATDWENFFHLRTNDAQPEIMRLANSMINALEASTPKLLMPGSYHIPFILDDEDQLDLSTKLKISVARVARTSYRTFDNSKTSEVSKDLELFNSLLQEMHLSPFEAQAMATTKIDPNLANLRGNFSGSWLQYRKSIELQCA